MYVCCKNRTAMRQFTYILFLLFSLFTFSACQSNNDASQSEKNSTSQADGFYIKDQKILEDDRPEGKLWLKYKDKNLKVYESVSGGLGAVSPSEYTDLLIPTEAIATAFAHWGETDYYYALETNGKISVYRGGPYQTDEGELSPMYDLIFQEN